MKKYFTLKKISLTLLLILLICQFFRIDKTTQPFDATKDFLTLTGTNEELGSIIKNSCYDCHSNQPNYPWYTNIAPVSWWIKHHINEGSHHLNFSEWGNYTSKRQDHKLEECVEMIEEDEMPMTSYTVMHGNAKLNERQKKLLMDWFNSLRTHESDKQE
jgi:Haem-binding domain